MNPPQLSVLVLGSTLVVIGERKITGWHYLDSVELLLFLLCHTRPYPSVASTSLSHLQGTTKEQIGNALWPNASRDQLDANLKARLHDVRQSLGAREWVLFENEQYKFNYTLPLFFDVRAFESSIAEAEQSLRVRQPDTAIAQLQQAVEQYRGEFLHDYRKRQTQQRNKFGDEDEIEWYVQKRYELQAAHQGALEKLGALLLDAERYEEAAETYKQVVTRDEYDDHAHRQLVLALARQGKRSQALQHYRQIVKRRADTPPEPELVALIEQLQRGELVTSATRDRLSKPPAAPSSAAPEVQAPRPFQVPKDLLHFVGREAELDLLREQLECALASKPPSLSSAPGESQNTNLCCLVGMGGIGKTSLAIHLAHVLREQFTDGVLWGHVATSEPLAILDSWARAFGCDYSSLSDVQSRAASLRSLLADKKVLFLLDDAQDAARVRPLLLNGAQHRVLVTTRNADVGAALDAVVIELPVLAMAESSDLLTRTLGTERVEAEIEEAAEICELLGNLPLALDITAHRLRSRPRWALREMVERLRGQVRRLAELKFGDRAVRAAFEISWEALSDDLRHSFTRIGVFDGRSFAAPAMAALAELDELAARESLDALVALSLLSVESSGRYCQHPLLSDFAREKLGGEKREVRQRTPGRGGTTEEGRRKRDDGGQTSDVTRKSSTEKRRMTVGEVESRFSNYYLRFASERRQNYLALEDEWDNLTAGIEVAWEQELWQEIIDYGDVLTDAWFARGRFSDARRAYPHVMQAARALEEQDAYIAATLNWGKACIDQGDYAEAEEHLQHGLQTSREVSDEYGMANALFLLGRVSVERSEYDRAGKYLAESQQLREKLGDRAGVAETLYMQARISFFLGNLEESSKLGNQAIEIQQMLAPGHAYIVTLRWVGRISAWQKRYDLAEEYIRKALSLAEGLHDLGEYATALYDLSNTLWRLGKYTDCKGYAEKSLRILKQIGDRKVQAYALELLSMATFDLREYELALEHVNSSLTLARELNDQESILRLLIRSGDMYEALGQPNDACQTRSEALPLARAVGHPRTSEIADWLDVFCTKTPR